MRRRIARSNVVAWLALFFSLTGTGLAASRYIITSTSQIKPSVLRQLVARPTATSVRGERGERGPQGTPGQSIQGSPGASGISIQGSEGPRGPQGAQGPQGATGLTGAPGLDAFASVIVVHKEVTVLDTNGETTAWCGEGEVAIGGGWQIGQENTARITASEPYPQFVKQPEAWSVSWVGANPADAGEKITVWAVCAK